MKVGDKVVYKGKDLTGTIAFIGNTQFSEGKWVGVVLDEAKGKNNGTVQGKKYFSCEENYGLFLRPTQIDVIDGSGTGESTASAETPAKSGLRKPATLKGRKPPSHENSPSSGALAAESSDAAGDAPPAAAAGRRPSGLPPPSVKVSSSPTAPPAAAPQAAASTGLPRPSTLMDRKASLSLSRIAPLVNRNVTTETKSSAVPAAAADPQLLGGLAANLDPTSQAEQDLLVANLRAEITDLTTKLETVELRRQEDRVKLKEYEKCKLQLQALEEYKKRMQEQVTEMQKQLLEAKNEKAQVQEAFDRYRDEMSDMAETVELATLDKEMAEEKCETLNSDLEAMKEKVEELTLELEILKEEAEGKTSGEGGFTLLQYKQLEQKNERMVEALVKLRDLSVQDKQEIANLQKEIAKGHSDSEHLQKEKERLTADLLKAQSECVELKEHVNAALGAETMIDDLTAKTLEYEEKLHQLTEERNDLEELNEMNDEMLETAKDTEMELRKEVDQLQVRLSEMARYIEAYRETVAERDRDLIKFRDMVCNLNGVIEDLRKQNAVANKQADAVHVQSVQAASHLANFQVKYAETKALSRVIDGELRQLDVEQGNKHVKYLLSFMPESFLRRGGDHDAILLLLLVARMNAKVGILISQVREKYPLPSPIASAAATATDSPAPEGDIPPSSASQQPQPLTSTDSLSFANYVIYQLHSLRGVVRQFENALTTCGVEQFCKFATLFPEVLSHEGTLDHLLEALRKDQLDDTVNLDGLERTLAYFHTLYQVHLASNAATNAVGQPLVSCSQRMSQLVPCVVAGADAVVMDAECLLRLMPAGEIGNDGSANLNKLVGQMKEVRSAGRTIRRHLPDKPQLQPLNFSKEVAQKINQLQRELGQVVAALHMAVKEARFAMPSDQEATLSTAEVRASVARAVTKQVQQVGSTIGSSSSTLPPEELLLSLAQRVCEAVCQLADAMEQGEYDFDGTKENTPPPPVTIRANDWRKELAELEATRARIEVKDDEVREVKMSLKLKQEEVSEMAVRVGMAEKKLEVCVRESEEKIDRLQQKLDQANAQLKRKEKEFEETMDALQNDVDSLEKDKKDLEEQVKKLRKRNLLEGLGSRSSPQSSAAGPGAGGPSSPSSAAAGGMSSEEAIMWKREAEMYRGALESSQSDLWRVQLQHALERFSTLPPLNVPEPRREVEEVSKLERRVTEARQEWHKLLLSPPFPGETESLSAYERRVADYALKKAHLKERFTKLQDEVNARRCQAGLVPTVETSLGAVFAQSDGSQGARKSVRDAMASTPLGEVVATVKLPPCDARWKPGVVHVPLVSALQLREVHEALLAA